MSVTFTGLGGVTLPNPEFGDSLVDDKGVTVNRSRGGELISFDTENHLQTTRFALTWVDLTVTEKDNLLSFITDNLGHNVFYTDQRGIGWEVFILTPNTKIAVQGRRICVDPSEVQELYNVSLELEVT